MEVKGTSITSKSLLELGRAEADVASLQILQHRI